MLRKCFIALAIILFFQPSNAQKMMSPREFLGYEIGERFTYHHHIVGYFKHVAENTGKVKLLEYGKTNENRPLIAVVISSEANLARMEQLRENNLVKSGLKEGKVEGEQLPIVWLSYNIHGNEASGSEVAIKALHHLVSNDSKEVAGWLEHMIIIIDPCLNPDGREKYAVWYHQSAGQNINTSRESWEHNEPWPGSRVNHYLFDLNRDWVWQTQKETQQRLAFYQKWMPHVHIDFHEMGYESPYFFAPGAKPYNEAMTQWQVEFQGILGDGLAKVFDERGELYFTNEAFDLFTPIFGDTWPTFNGALGFTFEQGGGSTAGLAVATSTNDTVSLKKRVDNHFASTLGTLSTVFRYKTKIPEEFNSYFKDGTKRFSSDYQSYIIRANGNRDNLKELFNLLDRNNITYYYPSQSDRKLVGYDYFSKKNISHQLNQKDIVIPAAQPHSHLVKVLFEPESKFNDTISYDLTAWSLPYIYGLSAIAVKEAIPVNKDVKPGFEPIVNLTAASPPYAWVVEWKSFSSVKYLAALLKQKVKVRYAQTAFEMDKKKFPKGSLIINRIENQYFQGNLDSVLTGLANTHQIEMVSTTTGKSDKGQDFGSTQFKFIKPFKIAILKGRGIGGNSVGELWFYFDQEVNYPVSLIDVEQIASLDISSYEVVIMPSGNYQLPVMEKIVSFAKAGGRVIALERSLQSFEKDKNLIFGKSTSEFREKLEKEKQAVKPGTDSLLVRFEDRRKMAVEGISASSIYRLSLDSSHPFSYGIGSEIFLSKRNSAVFPYLPENAYNVGYFKPDAHISGFVGSKLKKELENTLGIGQEGLGRGSIIYLTDSPVYRSFFHSGKLLLGNMVFLESSLFLQQRYAE